MIKFTYTKPNGEVSERSIIATTSPFPDYLGIDVSDIDPEALAVIEEEIACARDEYHEKLERISARYDLKHNMRRFKPERMTNISVL